MPRSRLVTVQNEAAALREQPVTVIMGGNNQAESNDLNQLQAQLENLLTRYTDRHPDVLALEGQNCGFEETGAKQNRHRYRSG